MTKKRAAILRSAPARAARSKTASRWPPAQPTMIAEEQPRPADLPAPAGAGRLRTAAPGGDRSRRRSRWRRACAVCTSSEHIIGVSVSATKRGNRHGAGQRHRQFAEQAAVVAFHGTPSARTPRPAPPWSRSPQRPPGGCRASAASGGGSPRSTRRWMFSSTTIASSTTRPMDSTSASRVSRLIEKPNAHSAMNAAITQTGTVTAGISAARTLPRNSQITSSTSAIASTRVL